MLSARFIVLVLCIYCFGYGSGYTYNLQPPQLKPNSNVQGSSNSINNAGPYNGDYLRPPSTNYGNTNNQPAVDSSSTRAPPMVMTYGSIYKPPAGYNYGQGHAPAAVQPGVPTNIGFGAPAPHAAKGAQSQGQSQATGGSPASYSYAGNPSVAGQKTGLSEASYGSADKSAASPPPKPPKISGFDGYAALGSYSQGAQGNPSYGNVGGYASAVSQTEPTITTTTTTTAAPAPTGGYVSDSPIGQGAQGSFGYGGGYAGYGNVQKKMDQPISTKMSTTTEEPTEATEESTEATEEPTEEATEEPQTTNAPKSCANSHRFCAFWKDAGECEKNPDYMKVNCALSCNTC